MASRRRTTTKTPGSTVSPPASDEAGEEATGSDIKSKLAAREAARFYNHPDADADFDEWLSKPYWEEGETVVLLLGKDPGAVDRESLRQQVRGPTPFKLKHMKMEELVQRAIRAGELSTPLIPTNVATWAVKRGLDIPNEIKAFAAPPPEKPLHAKERQTLHKMLFVLVADNSQQLEDQRIKVRIREIQRKIHLLGLTADDEPIRRWLLGARDAVNEMMKKRKTSDKARGALTGK